MKDTFLKYTSWCQAWDDIVDFNNLAKKTFGTGFSPLIDECLIDGKGESYYGYNITWWVHPLYQQKITLQKIKNMCDQLEYGHHIVNHIECDWDTSITYHKPGKPIKVA